MQGKIKSAKILDQLYFTVERWQTHKEDILMELRQYDWHDGYLIVRSSAKCEDSEKSSLAGHFRSVLDVKGNTAIIRAVDSVIESLYDKEDGVFIQPMLKKVKLSGVAFTRDTSNNSPYLKINYDDKTSKTSSITAGNDNNKSKVFYCHRLYKNKFKDFRDKIIELCFELEDILNSHALDIEFAFDTDDQLYLFQVRPLIISNNKNPEINDQKHFDMVQDLADRASSWMKPHPYLYGEKGLYGIMPDWNPAEIIGIKPRTLALSLYKEVVTDLVWAYQRDNYGYLNLRSFPLIIEFEGMPYIDVRVSFNSFIPKTLDEDIAEKLVNYYIDRLKDKPYLHDKVEFEIILSCYSFDLSKKIEPLKRYGISQTETEDIKESLRSITNIAISDSSGLWKNDLSKISILEKRYHEIKSSELDDFSKIYWLIEDCKRYGTLPFAGLARAGFIAVELLSSLVHTGILSEKEYNNFLASLDTVSSSIVSDYYSLDKKQFLEKYGHLRPGTYDILSKSYNESEEEYFDWHQSSKKNYEKDKFRLTVKQLNAINNILKDNSMVGDAIELLNFIKGAIEAREYAKFIFTRNISEVLQIYKKLCSNMGITLEDSSFTHVKDIMSLNSIASDAKKILLKSITKNKQKFEFTKLINLPPIIMCKNDFFSFHEANAAPNYITQKKIEGKVAILDSHTEQDISGKIVVIENADPGYDWIFSKKINGLITKYGGANSHMAIRSGELEIPAVIGLGNLYSKITVKSTIVIDSMNKNIKII